MLLSKYTVVSVCHFVFPASVGHVVEGPVDTGGPALVLGLLQFVNEFLPGLFLREVKGKCVLEIIYITDVCELGNPCRQHHHKQSDQQRPLGADYHVGLFTNSLKSLNKKIVRTLNFK